MASLRVSCMVALICMVVITAPMAEAAVSCGAVTGALVPCIPYLTSGRGPSPQCCGGVRRLNAVAQTTPDRKAACNCLKGAAGSVRGLNPNAAATLPGKCGVRLPYRFSTSTNCATIRF
ncbi:non-specific lipid-transfer protein 1-like [Vicia villosa]|uniref:non-specific lipid-transfer protein 1-like n=1 Tax=Vicia villosa TaxID=3911 RepID=UPI00273B2830|nr:non-specific lipid-transfer protein 1-like [Vicia villosa]